MEDYQQGEVKPKLNVDKTASQIRMEEELQRLKEECLIRMGIPVDPILMMQKDREPGGPKENCIFNDKTMTFIDDPAVLAKYGNPKIKSLIDDIVKTSKSMWSGTTAALPPAGAVGKMTFDPDKSAILQDDFNKVFSDTFMTNTSHSSTVASMPTTGGLVGAGPLGSVASHKWVTVELPLYVGKEKTSEIMTLMEQIYEHHGDDDTGSVFKVQDALDGFVNAHDNHIRQGVESGKWTTQFEFWVKLPNEEYANLLSSWPRDNTAAGSYVTIRVTARATSIFFVGYDFEQVMDSPLRIKLHIKCQNGHENRVEHVLSKLLLENGTFFVVGAADLNGDAVETFEVSKLGFVDVLSGQEQVLLN